jgi:hypothetical protein
MLLQEQRRISSGGTILEAPSGRGRLVRRDQEPAGKRPIDDPVPKEPGVDEPERIFPIVDPARPGSPKPVREPEREDDPGVPDSSNDLEASNPRRARAPGASLSPFVIRFVDVSATASG